MFLQNVQHGDVIYWMIEAVNESGNCNSIDVLELDNDAFLYVFSGSEEKARATNSLKAQRWWKARNLKLISHYQWL